MKANAITAAPVHLFQVWGDPNQPTAIHLPAGHHVFVLFSPRHQRYIMSITSREYRYDAFVDACHFVIDPTLGVEEVEADAPRYYLNRLRSGNQGVA